MLAKNAIGDLDGALEAAKKVLSFKPTHEKCIQNVKNLEEAIDRRNKDLKAKQILQTLQPQINFDSVLNNLIQEGIQQKVQAQECNMAVANDPFISI